MSTDRSRRERVMLVIGLRRDDDGYPPWDHEYIPAEEVGDHLFRLLAPPVFGRGLANGDVVRAVHYGEPESLWVEDFVAASGHSTARVVLFRSAAPTPIPEVVARFGCVGATTSIDGFFTIDIPPDADLVGLITELRAGRADGRFDYNIGVAADGHEMLVSR